MPLSDHTRALIAGTKRKLKTAKKHTAAFAKHPASSATLFALINAVIPFLVRFLEAGEGFESAKKNLIDFTNSIGTNSTRWEDAKGIACMSMFVPKNGQDPALSNYPDLKMLADSPFWVNLAHAFNGNFKYGTDVAMAAILAAILLWNYRQTTSTATVNRLLYDERIANRAPLLSNPRIESSPKRVIAGLKEFGRTLLALSLHVPKFVWLYSAVILAAQYLTIFLTDHGLGVTSAAEQFCDASNAISVQDDFHNPYKVIPVSDSINAVMEFFLSAISSGVTIAAPLLALYLAALRLLPPPPKKENVSVFTTHSSDDIDDATDTTSDSHVQEDTALLGVRDRTTAEGPRVDLDVEAGPLPGCCAYLCLPTNAM